MGGRSYLTTGRVNQKRRTRELLLVAAADLIRKKGSVSIADVADLAKVSRGTAYRYFPKTDLLIANAALWKVASRDLREFEGRSENSGSPYDNVDALVVESDRSTNEYENEFRAMLRVSLDQAKVEGARGRVRYSSLKKALAGLQASMSPSTFEKLVCALSLTIGIEALVVLRDVCLLPAGKAKDVKRWAAKSLLQAALAEAQSEAGKRKKSK
jgi:AcrR family transcriptional regulator